MPHTEILQWAGILFCISQSAMFSGLNLAFFSLSRLQLEVEVSHGNPNAEKILRMRRDSNFLLATILWGNVGINVLLTLLSNSLLAGVPLCQDSCSLSQREFLKLREGGTED